MWLTSRFNPRSTTYAAAAILASIVFFIVLAEHTDAHTPVTSRYNYNTDVFPILRDYCGSCHVKGGPAPMSLMTYNDAAPWAESIREELTAGRMPPWPVDAMSPTVQGGHAMSSHDIDVVTVWAAGGTPQGDPNTKLPVITFKQDWALGPPDIKLEMPVQHTLASTTDEENYECSIETNFTGTKWINAADLMPGTPSIVRDAIISVENGPELALWQPGAETVVAPSAAAFKLIRGSKIHLRIHYKRHFDQQGGIPDQSTVGLYFTDPSSPNDELHSFAIDPSKIDSGGSSTFTGALSTAARVVAVRPMLDRAYRSLNVDAITPSGTDVPLLRLRGPRPQWIRRYWLRSPVDLPNGSKIRVQTAPLSQYSDEPTLTTHFPLELVLDYLSL